MKNFKITFINACRVKGTMTYDNGTSCDISMMRNEYEAGQIKEKILAQVKGNKKNKKEIEILLEELEQLSYENGSENSFPIG